MSTFIDLYNKILKYEGDEITFVFDHDGKIWFNGANITNILGYMKKPSRVIRNNVRKNNRKLLKKILNKDEYPFNGQPRSIYIDESGLYTLIIRSKLTVPLVVKFQTWVTSDVLPSIRSTGKYDIGTIYTSKIKKLYNKIKQSKKRIKELEYNQKKETYPNGGGIYAFKVSGGHKIGKSKKPGIRKNTYNTGRSDNLKYEYFEQIKYVNQVEMILKAFLYPYRYRNKKEIYTCSLDTIKKFIKQSIKIVNNYYSNNNNINIKIKKINDTTTLYRFFTNNQIGGSDYNKYWKNKYNHVRMIYLYNCYLMHNI
jgi:prophage antirepressor-like protein